MNPSEHTSSPSTNQTANTPLFNKQTFKDERVEQIRNLWKLVYFFQIPSFLIFIFITLFSFNGIYEFFRSFLQYLSYSTFFVSSGIISFLWLQDFQRMRHLQKEQDYAPNLLESLRLRGVLKEKHLEVIRKRLLDDNFTNVIRIKIENDEYIATTNFFGDIIYSVWKASEAPSFIKDYVDLTVVADPNPAA